MIERESIKKILIRGTNWIGDAVLTTPAITAIGEHFVEAQVTLLAKPPVCELLAGHPHIDHLMVYESEGRHRGLSGRSRLIREIRSQEFDLLVLFQNAFEAALMGYFTGIPIRYGYRVNGRGPLLTHRVWIPNDLLRKHQVYYYLELLKPLGIETPEPRLLLQTTGEEDAGAHQVLLSQGVREGDLLIGFNPGATYGSAKRWPAEQYAQLGDRLMMEYNAKIVFFGNRQEQSLAQEISRLMGRDPILMVGQTSLRELMALLKRCHLLVTNDSGPMHVAAALGVPVVAIFGPTDPRTTSPFGNNSIVVRHEVNCSPCLLRECPIDHRCMEWLTVGEVERAVAQQLGRLGSVKGYGERSKAFLSGTDRGGHRQVAVFLDRDGTVNRDVGYVDRLERFELYPRSVAAIQCLNRNGIKVVLITNQSGIARGIISESTVQSLHRFLENLLKRKGAHLDGVYYCPHHPEEGDSEYTGPCQCRKPSPGLVEQASRELGIDPRRSYVVGDQWSDVELAHRVGAKGILVLTGHGAEAAQQKAVSGRMAEAIVRDLYEAVDWILKDLHSTRLTHEEGIFSNGA